MTATTARSNGSAPPADGTTRAQRRLLGKALRKHCPRADQAQWKGRAANVDPVAWLEESNEDRIRGLVPVRYGRMAQSALHFFRGTAVIQARDLADAPVSGIEVQLCGDCHLSNFGGFATPERAMIFDINDFDETFPGPWEWDLKRLAVSFVVAARYRSLSASEGEDAVLAAVRSYRDRMNEYADRSVLDMWYTQIRVEDVLSDFSNDKDMVRRVTRAAKKGRSRTSEAVFPKLTTVVDGRLQIVDEPPVIFHRPDKDKASEAQREAFFNDYLLSLPDDRRQLIARYRFQDAAIKVVGVGSVGTRCFIYLYLADGEDPLFLQAKEARRSVLETRHGKSRYEHQGARIVNGQRLMQSASDIFLGWVKFGEHDMYARQLRDMKVSAEIESLDAHALEGYATMCGWALARAHAKAGDAAMIAGYLGTTPAFDRAIAGYAGAYADQVDRDYAAFQAAIRSGRLQTDASVTADELGFEL